MTDSERNITGDFARETGSGLNRRMARGAAWMIGLRFADRFVGLLSTIVLARLLVPADFGLVALAMAMVATIDVFGEFGLEIALIQNQKAERSHYDTAWTLGLLRGVVVAVIIVLVGEPLAYFFEDPRLGDVALVLALLPLLEGFYNIGTVAFRKDLALNKEFIFRIVPRLAGVIITIALAFLYRNYWALVFGTLAGTALRLALSYAMHSYRPRISFAAWREIMGFSKWMVVTSIATFASRKADILIIAKFLDAASIGVFSMARQISNLASAELIAPIKQVLFPGYAKLAHDTALLRRAFLDVYAILVLVALPIAVGIGLTAEWFVPILLGPNWSDAVPLIEVLVVAGGIRSISSHARPVYLALDRPELGAYASIGRAFIFLPMLVFGLLQYGIMGAAIAHAIAQVAVLLGSLYLMHRIIRVSLSDIFGACWRAFIACALMVLAAGAIKWFPPVEAKGFANQLILLAITVPVGTTAYLGSVLLLWVFCGRPKNSAESYLLAYIGRTLRKYRAVDANISRGVGS